MWIGQGWHYKQLVMLTGTFLFLGCAVGALPLVFIHYATDEIVWERDIAVFVIVSAIAFVGLRKYFLKPSHSRSRPDGYATSLDWKTSLEPRLASLRPWLPLQQRLSYRVS
jgi:hypothetical protein